MRAGKKLAVYDSIKLDWGFEDYLDGRGKGVVLMTRFRSGSAGIGEELARYGGGGSGIWEDDGSERKKNAICRACSVGSVETLQHMLVECDAYGEAREEWLASFRKEGIVGGSSLLELMLGWRHPGLSVDGRLRMLAA